MGSQLQAGLPKPEHQSWEEVPTKYLAVKIIGDSFHKGEMGICWRQTFLKGQCTKFDLQPLTLDSGGVE